ncbi:hypothetical protein [Paraburkholderia rhynchosiae]|uniref:Uncharacterized protein n=1 Tax=Paraburkholderia rhynchosiae TaxID=487049 RepID=A0A6J5CFX2_9BURK|nr:hypothetical protein [Paraburkholderia rhynchosiae]CAB3736190.1 hypothetical protein LMG27174_06277 [Paraburkholderia rhynchosiae]
MKRRTRAILMIAAAGFVIVVGFMFFAQDPPAKEPCINYQGACIDMRVLMAGAPRHLLP